MFGLKVKTLPGSWVIVIQKRPYEHTLMNMINNEYLLLMPADPKWGRWLQVVVYAHILMNLAFIPSSYPQNWKQQKNSNIG